MDQIQEDVHKLAWNILLNGKHRGRDAKREVKIFTRAWFCTQNLKGKKKRLFLKQCSRTKEEKQDTASVVSHTHTPSLSFGSTVLEVHGTNSRADK